MRRSVLTLAVMAVVVLGAGRGLSQTLSSTPVTVTLGAVVEGQLVDRACFTALGATAMGPDHATCAIACGQKGQRLALVTATGDVYTVIGALTQDNNAKLIPLLNRPVVATGTVVKVNVQMILSVLPPSDSRRPTGPEDGILNKLAIRIGDFREGDKITPGLVNLIDAVSVVPKIP